MIACVSHETAPKRRRSSASVSPTSESGTSVSSLNRSGSSISNRRYPLLIPSPSLNSEANPLVCQRGKRCLGNKRITVRPTLAGKPPRQKTQGAFLSFRVCEFNDDHLPPAKEDSTRPLPS